MITLSAKDFEKRYGTQGVNAFSQTQPQNFFQDAKKDLADTALGVGNQGVKTFNRVMDVAQNQNFNPIQKFTGIMGGLAGGASGIFGEAVIGASKALLPQVTEDAIKKVTGDAVGSVITPEIAKKASTWYTGLNPDEKLVVDSAGGLGAFMFDVVTLGAGKAATTAVKSGAETAVSGTKKAVTDVVKNADITVTNAAKLREEVQALVGEKSVGEQVKTSAERLIAQEPQTPAFLKGTALRNEDILTKYDRYLAQSEDAINDIKVDPAISEVGSNMGDAFKGVVAQRRKVGEALGEELKTYGNLRVAISDSVDTLLKELKDSGLSYNPRTRQLTSFQGSRFADAEISMLNEFVARMNLLGKAPTISQIDNFIARARAELEFTKGGSGVMGTTNAERIINGGIAALKESLNPAKNGIQQLNEYWRVNQIYSKLSDFVDEGAKYLGKVTQSGDFAKDASIAKSAVQSILNNGKKDWMLQLEKLTGYNALDDAVLALQAMKDAGDYRGLSLLQAMKDSGIPTSKAGVVGAIIDKGVDIGKRVVAGTPAEQTRAFLKSLSKTVKTNLKVADKAVVAGKSVKKTPEIIKIEKKIAKNVDAQKAAIKAKDFTLVAKLKQAYTLLVAELKKAIKYLNENGSVGMSIKKTVTPESVAKRADEADMGVLDYVIRDYDNAILDPVTNRTLNDMGLGKATREERIAFAKEVFDEQAGVGGKVTVGKDTLDPKKYKSAENIPSNQMIQMAKTSKYRFSDFESDMSGNRLFHGTADDFKEFDMSMVGKTHQSDFGKGIYLTPDEGLANAYRRSSVDGTDKKGVVKEMYIDPEAKVKNYYEGQIGKDFAKAEDLQKQGYDAIYAYRSDGKLEEVIVMNPKVLYTSDQLTEIWNKANETKPSLLEEAKKYNEQTYYHGGGKIGTFEDKGRGGVYLTPIEAEAMRYAGQKGRVTKAKIQIKKPYIQQTEADQLLIMKPEMFPKKIAALKAEGYDALVSADGKQIFVFNASKVKRFE